MNTTIQWDGNMRFSSTTDSGHVLVTDTSVEGGGENSGPRPTELLLHAVAGCTAVDIVSILHKMRCTIDEFAIEIEGERADDHPRRFTEITLHYRLTGDIPEDKLVRAISLSKDKYCSVSQSLNAEVHARYTLNGVSGTVNA